MEILVVGIIILYILEKNKKINSGQFIQENTAFLDKLKESDYDFLVRSKYGEDVDPNVLFQKRTKNAFIVIVFLIFLFITQLSFLNVLLTFYVYYFIIDL